MFTFTWGFGPLICIYIYIYISGDSLQLGHGLQDGGRHGADDHGEYHGPDKKKLLKYTTTTTTTTTNNNNNNNHNDSSSSSSSKPTVYNFPQFPLYQNMCSCLGQWSATYLFNTDLTIMVSIADLVQSTNEGYKYNVMCMYIYIYIS